MFCIFRPVLPNRGLESLNARSKSVNLKNNFLFDFYEKLYFHEIEVREKLGGRLQTPMAIIVSLVGVLGFLILNSDRAHDRAYVTFFIVFLVLSASALVAASTFFVRSWFGYEYAFLPSSTDTEDYRKLLQKTYAEQADVEILVEQYTYGYICEKYISCATKNTQCNDQRSLYLHRTNGTLIIATVFVAISSMIFFLGDLDKSKFNKPTEVVVVKPVEIKGNLMTEKIPELPKVSPPPPPPPPPSRLIKEGVEIVKPQQEKKDGK